MKAVALSLAMLLGGCASLSADDWHDALIRAGQKISATGREMRPVVDPMSPSRIRF